MAPSDAASVPSPQMAFAAEGIVKRFPGVIANDGVHLDLREGEIHALLGENGAGKSTLMEIIYGRYRPDAGQMTLYGEPYAPHSARDGILRGVGMVHQHFLLIPAFTVAENIVLGQEPGAGLALRRSEMEGAVAALAERFGLPVDPRAKVADLPVGLRQRVEILKAFYRKARILILDEPTAALTVSEAQELFGAMRGFAYQGIAILFVTHKLDEVMSTADRVSVMRRGHIVVTGRPTGETTAHELAREMIGFDLAPVAAARAKADAGPGLAADGLTVPPELGSPGLRGVDLEVRRGEIVGVAGVEGNGQNELTAVLTGTIPAASGHIRVGDRDVTRASVAERINAGLGVIPADRQAEGLVLSFTVAENLALRHYRKEPLSHGERLDWREIDRRAEVLVKEYDVRPPDPHAPAYALSGGNQQKVIIAREVSTGPTAVIAAQPTRGLDILATDFVHRRLVELRDTGHAVLLVSLDLDEIFALADRIAVMVRGQIVAVLDTGATTKEEVGRLMLGAQAGPARSVPSLDPDPPTDTPATTEGRDPR